MKIDIGTKFEIASLIKDIYFGSDMLEITYVGEKTVKFTLSNNKGRGAMPIDHLKFLLKGNSLSKVINEDRIKEIEQMKHEQEHIV
ncbi:hypothetical protein [Evansella cellulosilytica]|uniref:Uncharacterized protein n=1 Tax=Evansella cellulosilytica (strain ATCC 21833 / DSM 2522 / FERM P-1141 / JCM 9156 / N-4) TaxID=649639 RepID=E6TQI7_EVAC2|nr:hypothetical protein [Evansella cellulosilytica]ADU30498.1 hypothetical protein Bcell_2238 [Evansella cellulosilytica DSM 2522]